MTFHRKVLPSYYISSGTLLAGYDMINDPTDPSVGGSGVAAPADGIKAGGPNDGTYFVAFTEDGTASHANRPASALADNTDFLDDVLNTSIPTFAIQDATAPGGGTSTIALTGQIYVGKSGTANNQTTRDKIVRITDQSNNDLEVSGSKIVATLIHDGSSNNVVGTQASGFRTNASVNVSPTIPATTTYRVWYGVRNTYTNIALSDKGPLFEEQMRTIQNVPGEVRSLLRQVHSEAAINQAWDAAFDSTIRSLAAAGLNERYRKATAQPAGFVTGDFNVAGSGRTIVRDGGAVEIRTTDTDYQTGGVGAQFPDPQLAGIRIIPNISARTLTGVPTVGQGGDIGYLHETEEVRRDGTVEAIRAITTGPAFMEVLPRDIRAATIGGDNVLTFINPTATASLNPDSVNNDTNRRTIQCAAGQYFNFSGKSAIRKEIDLLEVVYSGRAPETYVISSFISSTRVSVRRLNGTIASIFPAVATNCTIRWLQVAFLFGGSNISSFSRYDGSRFLYLQPSPVTEDFSDEVWPKAPGFFSALADNVDDTNGFTALRWGFHDPASLLAINDMGFLRGDGSIDCAIVRTTGDVIASGSVSATVNVSATGDLSAGDDLTVGDDAHITGDVDVGTLAIMNPDYHFILVDEDWHRATQNVSPAIIWSHNNTWLYNEIAGTFTLNNATPSTKNPGQLQFVGAGGSTSKFLSIYPTSQFPAAFANLELMTITVNVTPGGSNPAPKLVVGLFDSTTGFGNDNLSLGFQPSLGWFIKHLVGGGAGAHNNVVLGAQADGVFVVVRFVRQANGDIQVLFNGVLAVTVTVAQLPTGNCTFVIWVEQTNLDPDPSTYVIDKCYARFFSSTNRSGA